MLDESIKTMSLNLPGRDRIFSLPCSTWCSIDFWRGGRCSRTESIRNPGRYFTTSERNRTVPLLLWSSWRGSLLPPQLERCFAFMLSRADFLPWLGAFFLSSLGIPVVCDCVARPGFYHKHNRLSSLFLRQLVLSFSFLRGLREPCPVRLWVPSSPPIPSSTTSPQPASHAPQSLVLEQGSSRVPRAPELAFPELIWHKSFAIQCAFCEVFSSSNSNLTDQAYFYKWF